jgi:hypothetical protein
MMDQWSLVAQVLVLWSVPVSNFNIICLEESLQLEHTIVVWLETFSQYNMVVTHIPGKKHINADALYRIPD